MNGRVPTKQRHSCAPDGIPSRVKHLDACPPVLNSAVKATLAVSGPTRFAISVLQSRFGDKLLGIWVVSPRNETAVL